MFVCPPPPTRLILLAPPGSGVSEDALRRTVRRCTAVLAVLLSIGFTGTVSWFDGRPLALAGVLYLLVSGFLGLTRRHDERIGLGDHDDGADADSAP